MTLAAAWPVIRRILPYAGAVLALWAAYAWAHGRGVEQGKRSRDPEVAALVTERDTARANVATLEAAVSAQGKAVAEAAARTKAAQDEAARAARKAQERDKALAGVKARLEAAARAGGPVAGCEVPAAVLDAWNRL